jgi:hypothetical protein
MDNYVADELAYTVVPAFILHSIIAVQKIQK